MYVFHHFQTNLPVFKVKESSVRRRYSDFEWLRSELERDSKVKNCYSFLSSLGILFIKYSSLVLYSRSWFLLENLTFVLQCQCIYFRFVLYSVILAFDYTVLRNGLPEMIKTRTSIHRWE